MNTHPNSFAANYNRELAKFATVQTPGVARCFATKNVATKLGMTYEQAAAAVTIVDAM